MKTIKLTQGKFAFIDDEDFERVSKYKWYAVKNKKQFYVKRGENMGNNKIKHYSLHHEIMGKIPKGFTNIDHIDRNPLNNQKSNLRFCTFSQNMQNRRKQSNNSSGYNGVTWHKKSQKWRAETRFNKKHISLGLYVNIKDAAKAYNKFALEHHKEFAVLNEIN